MAALRAMMQRLRVLKRQGAKVRKVVAAGVKPATLYGRRALGLADTHVKTLRRAVSSGLPGGHRGRSTTLRLALNKAEV